MQKDNKVYSETGKERFVKVYVRIKVSETGRERMRPKARQTERVRQASTAPVRQRESTST